ncbi:hypothetical protein POVCU2_0039920 [Plasmodium ovale curtisi]|nr:hypothetical protein POVCU2_0039920 [Plasmodium ovale curtisi]
MGVFTRRGTHIPTRSYELVWITWPFANHVYEKHSWDDNPSAYSQSVRIYKSSFKASIFLFEYTFLKSNQKNRQIGAKIDTYV